MPGVEVSEGIRVAVAEGVMVGAFVGRTGVMVADGVVTDTGSGAWGAQDAEKKAKIINK